MSSGIYMITSPSGKRYIGSGVDLRRRWSTHKYRLRLGDHPNPGLRNAWLKYGEEGLVFEVIELCDREIVIEREQFFIDTMKPEYNVNRVAGSRAGMRHTDEAKRKMSEASKGRKASPETRAKLSAISRTKRHSPETLAKMRDGRRKLTPENLAKLLTITPEQLEAKRERTRMMGKSHLGKKMSDADRANMAAGQRRRYERDGGLSEAAKEKLRGKRASKRAKPVYTPEGLAALKQSAINRTVADHVARLDWIFQPMSAST